jgi:hypothetical protein
VPWSVNTVSRPKKGGAAVMEPKPERGEQRRGEAGGTSNGEADLLGRDPSICRWVETSSARLFGR